MTEQPRFNHIGPHFAVRDVARAIAFYGKALSLAVDYVDGDPPEYAVVCRDEVYIHLSLAADPDFNPGGGRAFVAVCGIDGVWQQVCSGFRTSVIKTLADWDFGHGVRFRGFVMKDLDGNVLRIGEPSERKEWVGSGVYRVVGQNHIHQTRTALRKVCHRSPG